MLNQPGRRIAFGVVLLLVISVGLGAAGGRRLLLDTHQHVVIDISGIDGIAEIFIDCHLAARIESGEGGATIDLGWLEPDDRIYISVTSIDNTPAWNFSASGNGRPLFNERRGATELPQLTATAHAVVFAKGFSAGGAELGRVGCQPPDVVAIEGYAWSPDDKEVAEVTGAKSSYRRANDFYDSVDAIGSRSLLVLAGLGIVAAILTPSIRRAVAAHKGLSGAALGILSAGFIEISVLPALLTFGGILLLLWVALRLVATGVVRLRRDAAADRSDS
jgi:hypothetical protein